MPSDEQLMSRAAEGDMEAFERLVERNQQRALNIAHRFLGHTARAEDVVQEAFLKILDRADSYRPTAKFATYLYSVIWRLCIDTYRKKTPSALESAPPQQSKAEGPDQAVMRQERRRTVRAAVEALPPRQRMAALLKYFEDMSYEEIAGVMDCTTSAVDSLLSRAREKLREDLGDLS
jgi:RNA polymerase sigma-70 factor (ECF subfamily)